MSFIDNTGSGSGSKDDIIQTLREQIAQQNMSALIAVCAESSSIIFLQI